MLPAIVLLPLVAYALIAGERLLPLPGTAPQHIEAEGRQWVWTFRYPDNGGVTTKDVLHLPAGHTSRHRGHQRGRHPRLLDSALAGKIDAVPGHVEPPAHPGRSSRAATKALCNEFCGVGHAGMRFAVIVDRPEDFAAALAQAAAPAEGEK